MILLKHIFDNINHITSTSIKVLPSGDQTSFYTYNTAQAIWDYLQPLCKYVYTNTFTLSFPQQLASLPPLQHDEEDFSYDVESLFTNIPVLETTDYIIIQIYERKKIKSISSKLIFCMNKCVYINIY